MQYRKGRKSPWMVQMRDHRGVVKTYSFVTRELAAEFERRFKGQRQARMRGLRNPSDQTLFFDYAQSWLKRRFADSKLSRGTTSADETKLRRYWLTDFGTLLLDSITTADLLEHLERICLENNLAPATRNRHRAMLHTLFQDALMRGKVTSNPVVLIPLIEEVRRRKRVHIKEAHHFDTYLRELKAEGWQYWALGAIMGWTGARISEAIGLQHGDIDEELGLVRFQRIEQRHGGSHIEERTKGTGPITDEEDAHVVPLFPVLLDAIKEVRRLSPFTRPTDFIACNPISGAYIPYDTFKDVHKRAVSRAKIPQITPHAIKRYFATMAKKAGYTRAEIREMLNQSSELVTARYDIKDITHLVKRGHALGFGSAPEKKLRRVK